MISAQLSHPSNAVIFIGPESDHWQCLSVTDSLTDWLLFSKLDWCDPGVWRCLLQTRGCYCCWCWWWGLLLQQFVADLEAEVWSQILTFVQTLSTLVKILKLKFRQDFEAEVWSVFCCWCLVEVTKFNLGQYFEARFAQDFYFRFSRDADV